jgi:hypothetical protein
MHNMAVENLLSLGHSVNSRDDEWCSPHFDIWIREDGGGSVNRSEWSGKMRQLMRGIVATIDIR